MTKRVFDFCLALFGLLISMPLWVIFALAIWLENGRPIFYAQERVGKEGRIFKGIKFRSMIIGAEERVGPVQAKENDHRVTRMGRFLRKTALDELPQLLNILKGQMSFVGPRALRPKEKELQDNSTKSLFDYPDFRQRCKVRPGLTGIAQVFAPRDIGRVHKFKYDLWYIQNQGFRLDIYIIFLSFLVTFEQKWEIRKDKFNFMARRIKEKIEKEIKILT